MLIKKKNTKKKFFVIAAILLGLAFAIVGTLVIYNDKQDKNKDRDATPTSDVYEPATEEEKQQAEDHKETLEEKDGSPVEDNPGSASLVITYADQYLQNIEVRSYVNGIIEENGTCTLTLTKGSQQITRTAAGVADARYTACPAFEVPRSELTESGTWQVRVSYASSTTKEVSTTKNIEVN